MNNIYRLIFIKVSLNELNSFWDFSNSIEILMQRKDIFYNFFILQMDCTRFYQNKILNFSIKFKILKNRKIHINKIKFVSVCSYILEEN